MAVMAEENRESIDVKMHQRRDVPTLKAGGCTVLSPSRPSPLVFGLASAKHSVLKES